ncbi:MAG: nucleotidyltransferase [Bacteroidales bacterium]|nr:nucleotidyltransferase [Bacteroidales bacterium]MDE6255015.1 nucleotidyltransferase substrate binding protein [Muribaculaceae bacterium]
MKKQDIRWLQRFENYRKALKKLEEAILIIEENRESANLDLLKEGLIQRFEFTHELAWKVMKDYLEYQGYDEIRGSRDTFRKSLLIGIIREPLWINSIQTRNLTSHTYDDEITKETLQVIISDYYPLMKEFENTMIKIAEDEAS